MATTLLCAFDPSRYAVMDWRARRGLDHLGLGVGESAPGRTVRYLARVRAMRDDLCSVGSWEPTARDIDKGLFMIGGSPAAA